MSVHVLSWVLRNSEETLGRRLVLLVLADKAEHDGTNAWPSVATIASESRMTERQVQRCLRSLEQSGAIRRTGRHRAGSQRHGTYVYDVLMAKGDISTPLADAKGDNDDAQRVSPITPEPSLEPSTSREGPSERPWRVDGKVVNDEQRLLAQQVLAAWNRATGQSLRAKGHLAKIVMRLREYPELGLDEHEHIITTTIAHPWWRGSPSPNVIYGNDAQFERQLVAATRKAHSASQSAFDVALRVMQERAS